MVRYTGKKNRIARRFGVNIFGRLRNPLLHKPNPPGQHGARRRKKSDFGLQLEEKQKLKAVYGMITEKQLLRYYKEASRLHGNTSHLLVGMLESRLDVVVYHLKFASTIFQAQQLVSHGHILVDGKKVDIRSYRVKPGQVISIKEKSKKLKIVVDAFENPMRSVPDYLSLDQEKCTGTYVEIPSIENVSWPIEINVPEVCDFLAHNS